MKLVFDIETNALELKDVNVVHCICIEDLQSDLSWKFRPNEIHNALKVLDKAEWLLGHNIIPYDLPVLEKITKWKPNNKVIIIDTLILSRLSNPDRKAPLDYLGNKNAPHSIECWGHRLGQAKVENEDWSQFTEHMLHRCSEDVSINKRVYFELYKEMTR